MLVFIRGVQKPSRGFTLIELLVVIAIIGLLSSVILGSLNAARNKGYDAERFSDLRQMQTILDSYYNDYGSYPVATGQTGKWQSMCGYSWDNQVTQNNVIMSGATSLVSLGYISSLPKGPAETAGGTADCYAYISNGTDYKFMDYNPSNTNWTGVSTKYFLDPARDSIVNSQYLDWAVYSPGYTNQ